MSGVTPLELGISFSPDPPTGGGKKPPINERIDQLSRPDTVGEVDFAHARGLLAILEKAETLRRENEEDKTIRKRTKGIIGNYPSRIRRHISKGTLPPEAEILLNDLLSEEEPDDWRE